jgi:hypothetical protein
MAFGGCRKRSLVSAVTVREHPAMAVRTEAVQYHSCDLCGHDRDEADLVRLYGPRQPGRRAQIDVCVTCQERPVADVIKWLVAKQHETALRPLRSVRGVGRT